jgi:hypothetical protein
MVYDTFLDLSVLWQHKIKVSAGSLYPGKPALFSLSGNLTLGVLRCFTSSLKPGLFTFLGPGVAR